MLMGWFSVCCALKHHQSAAVTLVLQVHEAPQTEGRHTASFPLGWVLRWITLTGLS